MNTDVLAHSQAKNGLVFLDHGKIVECASAPNVITSRDLNQIEMTQSQLTPTKYFEHKAVELAFNSLSIGSIYRGHENERIFNNIKRIVRDLISAKLFPKECYLGRMPFAGIASLSRAAIRVTPEHINNNRDEIIMYAIKKDYEPEELLRVLFFSSVNAASNGHLPFESVTCQKGFKIVRALPVSVRSGVLQGRYKTVKLFSAV